MDFTLKSLKAVFDKWRKLHSVDRRALATAVALMPLFWLGLRVLGLPRFQAFLARESSTPLAPAEPHERYTLVRVVNMAARCGPFRGTCLSRALLLEWMLRRRGVASQVRIGVHLANRRLQAHAWVECEGTPINDRSDIAMRYLPLPERARTDAVKKP